MFVWIILVLGNQNSVQRDYSDLGQILISLTKIFGSEVLTFLVVKLGTIFLPLLAMNCI